MKKILIVINSAKFFISHRLPLALEAQKQGFEVQIAIPPASKEERSFLESKGLKINDINLSRAGKNIIEELKTFTTLFLLISRIKPDVLHLITIKPVLYGGLISRFLRIPTLVAISGMGYLYKEEGNKFFRYLSDTFYKLVLGNKHIRVFVQNKNDKKVLKKISNIKDDLISLLAGSGVDLKEFNFSSPDLKQITFVMPCRMLWDKGVKEFVQAAENIKSEYPSVNFLLAGSCDNSNPGSISEDYLNGLNKENNVKWLGEIKDMPTLYDKASIVVVPSYYNEGLPKVLLEAAASGRGVITTDMPGCADAVDDNLTGMIIPRKDVKALSNAMLKFILDKALISRIGESARIKAEKEFDVKNVISKHIDTYHELSNLRK